MYKRINEELSERQIELLFTGFVELLDTHYPTEIAMGVRDVVMKNIDGVYTVKRGEEEQVASDYRDMFHRAVKLLDIEVDLFFLAVWHAIYEFMSSYDPVGARVAFERLRRVCDDVPDKTLN